MVPAGETGNPDRKARRNLEVASVDTSLTWTFGQPRKRGERFPPCSNAGRSCAPRACDCTLTSRHWRWGRPWWCAEDETGWTLGPGEPGRAARRQGSGRPGHVMQSNTGVWWTEPGGRPPGAGAARPPWVLSFGGGCGTHRGGCWPGGVPGIGGEFDPGSGSTLAACLMHASRTGFASAGSRGGRVRNTWPICPAAGGSPRKRGVIPYVLTPRVGGVRKGASRRWRRLRPIS